MSKETKKEIIEAVVVEDSQEPKIEVKVEQTWWDKAKKKAKQVWESKPVRVGRKIAKYGSIAAAGAFGMKLIDHLFGGGDGEDNPEFTTSDPEPVISNGMAAAIEATTHMGEDIQY